MTKHLNLFPKGNGVFNRSMKVINYMEILLVIKISNLHFPLVKHFNKLQRHNISKALQKGFELFLCAIS